MVSPFQALLLGLLQGLTEFLPVSSSGHLVLAQKLLGLSEPPLMFDVMLHVGSLTAVFIFFRKRLEFLLKNLFGWVSGNADKEAVQLIEGIVIGTIPAVAVGLLFKDLVEKLFSSVMLVGVALLGTAGLLFWSSRQRGKKDSASHWPVRKSAWVIGLFQALAITPGISRSGSTVAAGLRQGLSRQRAFEFSFLLSIPAVLGAMLLQMVAAKNSFLDYSWLSLAVGFSSAALSGYLALLWFKKAVTHGRLAYFGFYCALLGLIAIGLSL